MHNLNVYSYLLIYNSASSTAAMHEQSVPATRKSQHGVHAFGALDTGLGGHFEQHSHRQKAQKCEERGIKRPQEGHLFMI